MRRPLTVALGLLAIASFVRERAGVAGPTSHGPGWRFDSPSGLDFVAVEGGSFHFGCEPQDADCSDDERPGRPVDVAPMWLGRTEVTIDAYARCVHAGKCAPPSTGGACNWGVAGREQHPVNCVDWTAASTFCQFVGGRLPTAEEWEYAAKGGGSRIYPWGDEAVTDRRGNFADAQYKTRYPRAFDVPGQDDGWVETAPVGSYPAGATRHGLLDMTGNVVEWTASTYVGAERLLLAVGRRTASSAARRRSPWPWTAWDRPMPGSPS